MSTEERLNQGFMCSNAEQLIYQNQLLRLTVLGGIKLEGLDRMRATLKVQLNQSSVPPVRHSIDLYNDTQTEKLIRKCAEKLEIGTSVIAASLAELTEHLEQYRMERIKEQEIKAPEPPKMTTEERKEAEAFLQDPDLLKRTNELIGQSGVVGEELNRLIMYLIFTSRKRAQPLHIVSLGSSGTGKTHLQEKVGELIPEEDRIEITTLSENAFYYFGQRELKNKLILIEDLDGAENVLYPLRELQSKKKISKTIAHKNTKGETKTMHLVVEGPVSVSGCTTREQIYEDNANRSFLIYLDESEAQDTRIMNYQRKHSAGKINQQAESEAAKLLRNAQRLLQPIKVVNPFAEKLQIPKEVFKPRRTNNHYLQFIEAVTFYHQHQREQQVDKQSGEIFIQTTLEDIAEANQLLKGILLRKSDTISGACRNHFEKLKLYLLGSEVKTFSNRQISQLFRMPLTTVKRHHLNLALNGYLKTQKEKGSKAHYYEVVSMEEYEQLQKRINSVLDDSLAALQKNLAEGKQPKSSERPSSRNGLMNEQITSELKAIAQKPTEKDKWIEKSLSPVGETDKESNRRRIDDKEQYTLKLLQELEADQPNQIHTSKSTAALTGRSQITEGRYLKELHEQGLLSREWENREYRYRLKS